MFRECLRRDILCKAPSAGGDVVRADCSRRGVADGQRVLYDIYRITGARRTSFLRNYQTVFRNACTTLRSHHPWASLLLCVAVSSLVSVFRVLAILKELVLFHCCFNLQCPHDKWHWVIIFHMFICLLYIFFGRCLFRSIAHFLNSF